MSSRFDKMHRITLYPETYAEITTYIKKINAPTKIPAFTNYLVMQKLKELNSAAKKKRKV